MKAEIANFSLKAKGLRGRGKQGAHSLTPEALSFSRVSVRTHACPPAHTGCKGRQKGTLELDKAQDALAGSQEHEAFSPGLCFLKGLSISHVPSAWGSPAASAPKSVPS